MLETPCLALINIREDFVWGEEMRFCPFKPTGQPLFLLTLKMNEQGTFYSTPPERFEVSLLYIQTSRP